MLTSLDAWMDVAGDWTYPDLQGLDVIHWSHRAAMAREAAGLRRHRVGVGDGSLYRTLLRRIDPFEGSCDCADFLRSSLGLCKHLLTVLEDVASRRGGFSEKGQEPIPNSSSLRWDPVRPLTGSGDWLARVCWVGGPPDRECAS